MNIWDEIKNRFSCRDIAHEYGVNLSKKKAVCPFCHYKKNPSFYVTDDYFICHHCQKKGDVFNLIAEFEETERWDALKILCHRAGIEYARTKQDEERENVSQVLKLLCEHFLIKDENTAPWKYLIHRGLTPDFIKQKLVGFIPEGSSLSSLPHNLKKSKYLEEKKLPGFLSGRMLLPFWQGNQMVYLTGRTLDQVEGKKYLNITGQKTWTGNMRGPELIVTEGIFDQLLAEQAGFNCIATAGSGGKIKIHKGIKKILLCFDGDDQGREYIEKYALDFYEQGANVEICHLDEGTDLADFLRAGGQVENLEKKEIYQHYYEKLSSDLTDKEIKSKIYCIIKKFDDIAREKAFKQLKTLYGVTLGVIRKDYFNSRQNTRDDFLTYDGVKFKIPEGYLITKHGIFNGTNEQISFEPVFISRCGINHQNGVEYVELSFNSNGNTKRRIVDRITISSVSEIIKESQYGAPVNSGNALHIINFLAAWISVNKEGLEIFEVVNQMGWFKNHFILTDRIIGKGENLNVYYKGSLHPEAFTKKGDLNKWTSAVKKLKHLENAQIARFCIYAGFAAIAWENLKFSPVIIHLYSNTSKGKTTLLKMVSSIFGNPEFGKGIITWDSTQKFIIRYLEHLRNVPLCIDELTSKNMRNFQGLIYAISGGVSRGKASRNDPLDIVELRNFSTLVFSNGEPPMLSQNSFAGETVRVWELTGPPFGVDDEKLINEIVSTVMENFGHAVEHFVLNYLNLNEEFKNPESFLTPDKINSLSNAERRILKQLDVIYFTGLIINEIFRFDFPVKEDIEYIFKAIGKQIEEKVINIDNILSEIADYVSINHSSFPVVGKDINQKNTIIGKVLSHQKIFGFLFPNANDGHDLGIIKSHFIDWMNVKWNSNTGGLYVFSILKEKGIVPNRCQKRIDEKIVDLVYLENFFNAEKLDNNGVKYEDPFG